MLKWIERGLFLAGIAAVAWCAVVLVDTQIVQRRARHALTVSTLADTGRTSLPSRHRRPEAGEPVADLSIPRLQLSAIVLQGSSAATLRRGPGHIEETAWPGEPGNVGIAAHRDTFFRPLRGVRIGDDVVLATPYGRWQYRVSSTNIVSPTNVGVLASTSHPTLTLVTCYPFSFLGHAPLRFIVRADRVDPPR